MKKHFATMLIILNVMLILCAVLITILSGPHQNFGYFINNATFPTIAYLAVLLLQILFTYILKKRQKIKRAVQLALAIIKPAFPTVFMGFIGILGMTIFSLFVFLHLLYATISLTIGIIEIRLIIKMWLQELQNHANGSNGLVKASNILWVVLALLFLIILMLFVYVIGIEVIL